MNAVPIAAQPNPSTAVAAFLKREPLGLGRDHSHAAIELYPELKSVCMMV